MCLAKLMTQPLTEYNPEPNRWIGSAKWTCAVCSFTLALNLVATAVLANVPVTAVISSLAAAVLFIVCGVGYLLKRGSSGNLWGFFIGQFEMMGRKTEGLLEWNS